MSTDDERNCLPYFESSPVKISACSSRAREDLACEDVRVPRVSNSVGVFAQIGGRLSSASSECVTGASVEIKRDRSSLTIDKARRAITPANQNGCERMTATPRDNRARSRATPSGLKSVP